MASLVAVLLAAAGLQVVAPPTAATAMTVATGPGGLFVPAAGRLMASTSLTYNTWKNLKPGGSFGIPTTGVSAVQVTISAVNPTTPGNAYVRPHGSGTMSWPALSFDQGMAGTTSNTTIVALGPDGTFDLEANTTVNMTVDVQGYFTDGAPAAGGFMPLEAPARLVDTRNGTGLSKATIAQNSTVTIDVGRNAGVPADASAVFVNLEVLNNTSSVGLLQPYAADQTNPGTSLSFAGGAGVHTSLGATIDLSNTSPTGQIKIRYGSAPAGSNIDLVVDVIGYYTATDASSTGAVFTPAAGQIIDRAKPISIASGATVKVAVAGVEGIPSLGAGLVAVVGNVQVDDTTGKGHGFLTLWADDQSRPGVSSMDYTAAAVRSNFVTVAVGSGNGINIYNGGTDTVHVALTIQGWYTARRAIDSDLEPLYRQAAGAAGFDSGSIDRGLYSGEVNTEVIEAILERSSDGQESESERQLLIALGWPDASIPGTGSAAAVLDTSEGTLTLHVPAHGANLDATASDSALFEGTSPDTNVAVQDNGGSLQALAHIDSAQATERYDFTVGGDVAALTLTDDGGVDALDADGELIATMAPPWAVDADGVSVPTHYEINGTTITQIVEHHGGAYAYPIVADPKVFGCDWHTYTCVKFTKSETKSIASKYAGATSAVGPFVATFCGKIKNIVGAAVCAAVVGTVGYKLGKSFDSAAKKGKCVEVHISRGLGPVMWWKTEGC